MTILGNLYAISAPSGGGKTSLVQRLLTRVDSIQVSVSHTTRPKRSREVDGKDYYFIDEKQFLYMLAENTFIEHAKVFDHYYGTSKNWLEETLRQGIDVVLEIDWQGAAQIRKLIPKTVGIFILPPSRETLESRLRHRGQDSDAVIAGRLNKASEEISHFGEYDYLIVNDDFDRAVQDLTSIVLAERLKTEKQQIKQQDLLKEFIKTSV